jgi:hypothetical protein
MPYYDLHVPHVPRAISLRHFRHGIFALAMPRFHYFASAVDCVVASRGWGPVKSNAFYLVEWYQRSVATLRTANRKRGSGTPLSRWVLGSTRRELVVTF